MTERPLILVIEDQYFLQADVVQALTAAGFEADAVFSGEEALTLFASGTRPYKALIADVRLGGSLTGWEVARRIREKDSAFPVIYLTASYTDQKQLLADLGDKVTRPAELKVLELRG